MNEEELEQDELEQDELDSVDNTEEDDEGFDAAPADEGDIDSNSDSDDEAPVPVAKKSKKEPEIEELPSVESKQKERDALARAMEEFLARGGKVQEVEADASASADKKA